MKTYKPRLCTLCDTEYAPTGPAARYCKPCASSEREAASARATLRHRSKYQKVGVGSGGNQEGVNNHQWKGGVASYRQYREKSCNRCSDSAVLVHHIDHDRANNDPSNLESLCKRCHQIEHRCWENLEGSETIPQGSTH